MPARGTGLRGTWRRGWFGLATVLGWRRRGFFIPYRYAAAVPPRRDGYPAVEALFAAAADDFRAVLRAIDGHADALRAIAGGPPPAARWQQDWFPRLDAAAAYALVRERAPARIVEVGSGHSTRFLARAATDAGRPVAITAIDPAPRAALDGLSAGGRPVALLRAPLQQAGGAPFDALAAGDMLFIDSSHILMPGTDVDRLLNDVLPRLPAGVLVHLHDVFLPDAYPADWDWYAYNEQLAVAPLLTGGAWRPLFASHYVATRMADAVAASVLGGLPLPAGAKESSLWLQRR